MDEQEQQWQEWLSRLAGGPPSENSTHVPQRIAVWADEEDEEEELGADTVQEHLSGLSVDERKVIEMEARENREDGWDAQNEDTFGASSSGVWTFEDQCAANACLSDGWPAWQPRVCVPRSVDGSGGLEEDAAGKLEEGAAELHESVSRPLAWEDVGADDDDTAFDVRNEDTFGVSASDTWTFEEQCAANEQLSERWRGRGVEGDDQAAGVERGDGYCDASVGRGVLRREARGVAPS